MCTEIVTLAICFTVVTFGAAFYNLSKCNSPHISSQYTDFDTLHNSLFWSSSFSCTVDLVYVVVSECLDGHF